MKTSGNIIFIACGTELTTRFPDLNAGAIVGSRRCRWIRAEPRLARR
jgi:hypothetical protein